MALDFCRLNCKQITAITFMIIEFQNSNEFAKRKKLDQLEQNESEIRQN